MGIAMDLSRSSGGSVAGAQEMGRRLMHGDRAELKLGYSARAAFATVRAAFEREALKLHPATEAEIAAYLIGYSRGMRDAGMPDWDALDELGIVWWCPEALPAAREALRAGFDAGQDTDVTKVYPADVPSLAQPPEEIDGTRAGADMH